MTARDIQRRLVHDLLRESHFVMPNYTPLGWWECDIFRLTKRGYYGEYEVKVTMGDFRADAAKARDKIRSHGYSGNVNTTLGSKHQQLAAGNIAGPKQFWFVVPITILDEARKELPKFAGLMFARPTERKRAPWNIKIIETVPAPHLHNEKISPQVETHVRGVGHWRFLRNFTTGRFWTEEE